MSRAINDHQHRPVDIPDSARAAIETVAAHPAVRAIIVFGSRAAGDHDARSDIDVAIEAPGLDPAAMARLRDGIARFPTLYRISMTRLDTMPSALKDRVLAQGVTIYERAEA
ncbi:nucleotidyltransferase domain-containing protein [Methylobacterium sp. J-092]|uniref:nucleotidyltransferase domain-containing protein n=1 Tax=Methylobacterium sp. J-092 TaxID=2836667 RepID=UPI001FBA6EB0|nr:nucleotidyltransferase domain-containing protein [Methylobacterium sp. J-092]MCJ2007445.1 nucleotidyltransferase domain-containing protein [Methylobacterium sp. J-092]